MDSALVVPVSLPPRQERERRRGEYLGDIFSAMVRCAEGEESTEYQRGAEQRVFPGS